MLFGSNTCFTSALSLDVTSEHICALSQTPLKSAAQYMSAFHSTSWGSICAHSCFTSSHILKKQATWQYIYITPKGCQDLLNNCRVTLWIYNIKCLEAQHLFFFPPQFPQIFKNMLHTMARYVNFSININSINFLFISVHYLKKRGCAKIVLHL